MSARGACVLEVSEGELTNPPVLSCLHSLNIDAEYVFISLNTSIILFYFIFLLCIFFSNQVFCTCNIWLINKPIFLFNLYNFFVGMNWHKSYFATSYHNDNANQLHQHTFEERMDMNWHKSHTRTISSLHFYFQRFQS